MANALTYQSEFTGPQMDERFAAVAQLQAALLEVETALSAKYVKPASGIPETDMDAAVQSALAKARSAVQDLSNYYTKTEIDALLSAVNSQEYVDVASLPTASASTLGKIYLVGPDSSNQYARYYTSYDGSDYSWVAAGSTEINLALYATKAELSQLDQKVNTGIAYTEQTPTKVSKLQINSANTAFSVPSNAALAVHYIPCTAGQIVKCTASHGSAQVFKYGFSTAVPADGVAVTDGTRLEQTSINLSLTAPFNGYFAIYHNDAYFADQKMYTGVNTAMNTRLVNVENALPVLEKTIQRHSLGSISLTGNGNNKVVSDAFALTVGHHYRFFPDSWPTTYAGTGDLFAVYSYDSSDNETRLAYTRGDTGMVQYLDVVIPSGSVSVKVGGRVTSAATAVCSWMDVTALPTEKKHLEICILGNSYSADAWRYVPTMLLSYGITCHIEFYYRGAGSLWDLDSQWTNSTPTDISHEDEQQHSRFHFYCDSRLVVSPGKWYVATIESASDILDSGTWDLIFLQQRGSGGYNADIETYSPYLGNVLKKIFNQCEYPVNICWFESYNALADNSAQENALCLSTQETVYKSGAFTHIFPVGAAVFNAQKNATLAEIGDDGKLYASDGVHLQEGLPCYVAACTVVQSILNIYKPEKSVFGNTWRPSAENIADLGMDQTINGDATGVTDDNCFLAQECALAACNAPFSIVDIQTPEDEEEPQI